MIQSWMVAGMLLTGVAARLMYVLRKDVPVGSGGYVYMTWIIRVYLLVMSLIAGMIVQALLRKGEACKDSSTSVPAATSAAT